MKNGGEQKKNIKKSKKFKISRQNIFLIIFIIIILLIISIVLFKPSKLTSLAIFENFLKKEQEVSYDCLKKVVARYCINQDFTHYNTEIKYPTDKEGYVFFECSSNDERGVIVKPFIVSLEKLNIKEYCKEDFGGG